MPPSWKSNDAAQGGDDRNLTTVKKIGNYFCGIYGETTKKYNNYEPKVHIPYG